MAAGQEEVGSMLHSEEQKNKNFRKMISE